MEILRGRLLIAGPALYDPNFRRTVVLVGEHTEDGALGVVLNRPGPVAVDEAAPMLGGLVDSGEPLFFGGPVQQDAAVVLAEFDDPGGADLLVFGSIGFLMGSVDPDALDGVRRVRVFAGYAGWGPGQLEGEIDESSWILEPALTGDVFSEVPERLWSDVLRRKGGRFAMLSLMPVDPSMN